MHTLYLEMLVDLGFYTKVVEGSLLETIAEVAQGNNEFAQGNTPFNENDKGFMITSYREGLVGNVKRVHYRTQRAYFLTYRRFINSATPLGFAILDK